MIQYTASAKIPTSKKWLKSSPHLDFQTTQPMDKGMSHEIPGRLWESVGAYIFTTNNKHYLCILNYHSQFPVIKQVERFSSYNLIKTCNFIFSEYGQIISNIVWHVATNFISEKFENVCKKCSMGHAANSSYNHQRNWQAETCIKFVNRTRKNAKKLMLTHICLSCRQDQHWSVLGH